MLSRSAGYHWGAGDRFWLYPVCGHAFAAAVSLSAGAGLLDTIPAMDEDRKYIDGVYARWLNRRLGASRSQQNLNLLLNVPKNTGSYQ
jgi:hypothetical protein